MSCGYDMGGGIMNAKANTMAAEKNKVRIMIGGK